MKVSDFCNYFEFSVEKEYGIDEDGNEYNFVATDQQGVFQNRYAKEVKDFLDMFDSCIECYINEDIEDYGFQYSKNDNRTYYEQALEWVKNEPEWSDTGCREVIEAIVDGELEDDLYEPVPFC